MSSQPNPPPASNTGNNANASANTAVLNGRYRLLAIVASGGMDLANRLEQEGYEAWRGPARRWTAPR